MPCSVPFWPLVWLLIPSYSSLAKAFKKKITQKGNPTWDSDLLQPSSKIKTKEGRKLVLFYFALILCCTHGNQHTWTHDTIRGTFVAMAWNVNFHVGQKQLHTHSLTMFHSFCRWLETRNCVHQRWNSHFSQCYHCRPNMNGFFSLILHNSKICCSSNQIRSYHDQHPLINSSF
jgi:hypothetical protein